MLFRLAEILAVVIKCAQIDMRCRMAGSISSTLR